MRLIGELDDRQLSEKFCSYLITEGIAVQTEEIPDGGCEIWIKDEDQFEQALKELEIFRGDSGNQKYSAAVQKANQISRAKAKKQRQIQKKIVNVGSGGFARKPKATLVLIGICVIVALFTDFGGGPANGPLFKILEFVSLSPPAAETLWTSQPGLTRDSLAVRLVNLKQGEIWRVVTPIFIHYGTMHILFNMIWLFQLGKLIENRYGSWWLLILVLITAAVSNFFQCTVPVALGGSAPALLPDGSLVTRLGGMSGVIYGLLGYVWMKSLYDRSSGFYLPQSTLFIMLGWMLFCMIPGATQMLLGSNIANWAHAIGLITGMAIGYAPVWMQQRI